MAKGAAGGHLLWKRRNRLTGRTRSRLSDRLTGPGERLVARARHRAIEEGRGADDDIGKMHFKRMDEGSTADFQVMARVHQQNLANLPDLLLSMLSSLKGDEAYPVDRLTHSVQSATRALRDGKDEEYVVCCLLHDVCEALGPFNHGEVIAAILKPFISEANRWMLAMHGIFQTYFYGDQIGLDRNQRERYRDSPYYERTVEFTSKYDEVSFDPGYPSEPLSVFEPMVRRVLSKTWSPPKA